MKPRELVFLGILLILIGIVLICLSSVLFNIESNAVDLNMDFEMGNPGWYIPGWTQGRNDYVAKDITLSNKVIKKDSLTTTNVSLKINSKFPKKIYACILIECQLDEPLQANIIQAEVYLPNKAWGTLFQARVLVYDELWREQKGVPCVLKRKKWTTIKINPKFPIKKIAIKIERNANAWDQEKRYKGAFYIDNIKVVNDQESS